MKLKKKSNQKEEKYKQVAIKKFKVKFNINIK